MGCVLGCQDQVSHSSNLQTSSSNSIIDLSISIQTQIKLMERIQESADQISSEKKDKFDKLHDSTKVLILNVSSRNGEVTSITKQYNI